MSFKVILRKSKQVWRIEHELVRKDGSICDWKWIKVKTEVHYFKRFLYHQGQQSAHRFLSLTPKPMCSFKFAMFKDNQPKKCVLQLDLCRHNGVVLSQ